MGKFIKILALLSVFSIALCSCQKEEVKETVTEPIPQITEQKVFFKSPLTNLPVLEEDAVGNRPVAVMINNVGAALPHRGISKADIVYEVVVEGGITRLLAIFSDTANLPYIGPIRSSRHYYVDFALPYNAVYLHFGGSPAGYQRIKSTGIDNIDGIAYSKDFYQDMARANSKGKEHSYFVSQKEFDKIAKKSGISLNGETKAPFAFYEKEYFPKNNDAAKVFASFSGSANSTFIYDKSTGLYSKQRNGAKHIDANTGNVLQYKNILILYTGIGSYNGEALRRDVALNSGSGYYITNGGKEVINWKKGNSSNQFVFTDQNGEALKVNSGKTYICILGNERKGNTTIK